MRVLDAFAGIGGFSCAADALGWETVAFVERDKDCQFWLGQHWPNVPIYDDICEVKWEDAPPCDIFTAGFPCQPHSVAGKRKASDDDRDLWSECVRAISTLRPRYAVLENVPGLLTSESGRFFNRVISDLAKIGYVGRYDVLSAAECGAPHRRERVWIVAWPSVGDTRSERPQGHGRSVGQPVPAVGSGTRRHGAAPSYDLRHPWSDAIPYRGADGTVRLIPAGAVADASRAESRGESEASSAGRGEPISGERSAGLRPEAGAVADDKGAGREASRTERSRDDNGSRGDGGLVAGEDGAVRGAVEVSRPEPSLRPLVDGLPDEPLGRPAAEEITQWATPRAGEAKQGPSSTEKHRLSGKDWMLSDEASDFANGKPAAEEAEEIREWLTPQASDTGGGEPSSTFVKRNGDRGEHCFQSLSSETASYSGTGGSLWPVTESEPGRVARLKAVGNAIVPAFALYGPFRYILELEHGKEYADEILRAVR